MVKCDECKNFKQWNQTPAPGHGETVECKVHGDVENFEAEGCPDFGFSDE